MIILTNLTGIKFFFVVDTVVEKHSCVKNKVSKKLVHGIRQVGLVYSLARLAWFIVWPGWLRLELVRVGLG